MYFVTGIGTDVGKTVVSAILTEAFGMDYWKPIQAGGLDFTDTDFVKSLVSNQETRFHPERFRLNEPMSPHAAAKRDGIKIDLEDFQIPVTDNNLIIEGAGGIMVPINESGDTILNIIKHLNLPVILVSGFYLGSINHTLLSAEVLKLHNIEVEGLIFNGEENPESREIILNNTGLRLIGSIPKIDNLTPENIKKHAINFKNTINHEFAGKR